MEASALRRDRALLPRSKRLLGTLSDDRLVDYIRRGNVAAFEVIYDRHYRGILAFCRHMLGSREEAEDAVQQTFASAYTDLQSNRRDIRLKAWLYTIARNRSLTILRARREQPAEIDDVPTAGLSEQVQQRADLQELLRDLHDLPADQREALVLFEIGDLTQAEVADVIGVEPMKVKALVFQARSALIENRDAREIPCTEIREQLATATGGALRRGPLRRHIKACEGCRQYRDQVRAQRSALALVLPVVPTAGLKDSVLAAIGLGGGAGGGGAAAGAAAGSGGTFAALTGAGAAKLAVGAALGIAALGGGGIAVKHAIDDGATDDSAQAAEAGDANQAAAGGGATAGGGGPGSGLSALIGNGSAQGRAEGDESDDETSDDEKSDDEKSDDENGKSHRGRKGSGRSHRGGRRGASRGRGSSGRRGGRNGNGRGGTRRHGSGSSNGHRSGGRRSPSHPLTPPPRTGGSGGSSNGGGTGSGTTHPQAPGTTTPDTTSGDPGSKGSPRGNAAAPPAAPTPPADTGDVEKQLPLTDAVPLPG